MHIESFLNYAKSGKDDGNPLATAIHKKVETLNKDKDFLFGAMKTLQDSIYQEGREEGLQKGISGTVKALRSVQIEDEKILKIICSQYHLQKADAEKYFS